MDSFSISRLLGNQPPNPGPNPPKQAFQILTFRPSPHDANATLIERENAYGGTTPLFSITSPKGTKNVMVYRVGAGNTSIQPTLIGSSKYSSMSGNTQLNFSGQNIKIRTSGMGDGYKFSCPPLGNMKWRPKMRGGIELKDSNGHKLALYDPSAGHSGAGSARLEILIPCDDYLLDLLVVTGMAAWKMSQKEKKAIDLLSQVISA